MVGTKSGRAIAKYGVDPIKSDRLAESSCAPKFGGRLTFRSSVWGDSVVVSKPARQLR